MAITAEAELKPCLPPDPFPIESYAHTPDFRSYRPSMRALVARPTRAEMIMMNWNTLASTLLGALITYSAILLTQAIELWKRKRTHESLIRSLLQALHEEVETLLEMARMNAPSIEDVEFRNAATRLLELLSAKVVKVHFTR